MTAELITDAPSNTWTAEAANRSLTPASAVDIRAMNPARDTVDIHAWLTHPRAHYWQMT
ncbi:MULTISPECIES: hypothetical protein [Brevibacterium]|uniref:Uncharacterized protein n=2 Tax=Brevibacterium antiquum TaxID=234835 RepID=A0A2H1KVG9_9MICO|nr:MULTISPECIES: hypothetical protein [Brevibacterium]SMX89177.1 hypothetical protein BANT10_02217 [Brevibacterium antiquum]SMY03639.1 hypothetical protein BANT918_02882 [Brevibacterium antiquum CNRZ 918]